MKALRQLPVFQYRSRIIQTVAQNPVTIIAGEPGCGKSTVVPQLLLQKYRQVGKVCVTQPRRLAARSLARHVARQLDVAPGSEVGFKVRFDYEVSPKTNLLFITEGVLLQELRRDPLLERYSVVILDEIHERGVDMDLCLGLVKILTSKRQDIRIVLMSATIDLERVTKYFENPPVINVLGKKYPVSVRYVQPKGLDIVYAVVDQLHRVCRQDFGGRRGRWDDILVFLPGEGEIMATVRELESKEIRNSVVLPLHASLKPESQERIFQGAPKGMRKIVLATNIAETSVTVPGISVVIDSGLIRQPDYDYATGIGSLKLTKHSRAGCDQRAGRAGRTRAGTCYRLFTSQDYHARPPFNPAQICRISLADVYLKMCAAGINDPFRFPFLERPDQEAFHEAHEILHILGMVDEKNQLTSLGRKALGLPLTPRLATVLLTASEADCIEEALTICAILSSRPILYQPQAELREAREAQRIFHQEGSDCLTALNIFQSWEAAGSSERWCNDYFLRADILREISRVREQLRDMLMDAGINVEQAEPADRAALDLVLMAGFGDQLWHRSHGRRYERETGEWCAIDARSAAYAKPPEWFICSKVLRTKKPIAIGIHPVQLSDLVAALTGNVAEVRLPQLRYSKAMDAVTAIMLKPQQEESGPNAEVVKVHGEESTRFLAMALAENRLSTADTSANRVLIRELDMLRERLGDRVVPRVSIEWLKSFYETRLASAQSLDAAEGCDLAITLIVVKSEFGCDLDDLRRLQEKEYPDAIIVRGRSIPVRYENQVPMVVLTPDFVESLSYDALSLPNGDLVHIEMTLPSLSEASASKVVTTSINELKQALIRQHKAVLNQEELQRKCDDLRQQIFALRQSQSLTANPVAALRALLDEAEEALYGWSPNLERGARVLHDLESRLN